MSTTPTRDLREIIREEPQMHRPILAALAGGPLSVPEIAQVLRQPSSEVMFWVMGMRRYGLVREIPEAGDDGYFRYDAVEGKS